MVLYKHYRHNKHKIISFISGEKISNDFPPCLHTIIRENNRKYLDNNNNIVKGMWKVPPDYDVYPEIETTDIWLIGKGSLPDWIELSSRLEDSVVFCSPADSNLRDDFYFFAKIINIEQGRKKQFLEKDWAEGLKSEKEKLREALKGVECGVTVYGENYIPKLFQVVYVAKNDEGKPAFYMIFKLKLKDKLGIPIGIRVPKEDSESCTVLRTRKYSWRLTKEFGKKEKNKNSKLRGAFGKIKPCASINGKGSRIPADQMLAVKKILFLPIWSKDRNLENMLKEIDSLRCLEHPGIPKLFDYMYIEHDKNDRPATYLVIEYITNSKNLFTLFIDVEEKHSDFFDDPYKKTIMKKYDISKENMALWILSKVCDIVAYIHSQGILHGDLKPENILLKDNGEFYVVDFGLSKNIEDPKQISFCDGTPQYISIEIMLDYLSGNSENYDGLIETDPEKWVRGCRDVWALGCILYNLLESKHVFYSNSTDDKDTQDKITDAVKEYRRLRDVYMENLQFSNCEQVLRECFKPPENRISIEQLIIMIRDHLKSLGKEDIFSSCWKELLKKHFR